MKITEILSIYAALISTIVFGWNIRKSIPTCKVEIMLGSDKVDDEYVTGAYIVVKNPSAHIVHLSNISILYPFGKGGGLEKIKHAFKYRRLPVTVGWCGSSLSYYGVDDKCPVALESGKSLGIFISEEILEKIFEDCEVREIKVSVQDGLSRNKYSRKFEYPQRVSNNT